MNFNGYLIRFPKSNKYFPHKLIAIDSYKCTPLQRTEIKAYRDSNNFLHRTTSPNYKTKIEFTTVDNLYLNDMRSVRSVLNSSWDNSQQRKIRIEYWDDELLAYRIMTAYMPDITYTVKTISSQNIRYNAVTFTFIEY